MESSLVIISCLLTNLLSFEKGTFDNEGGASLDFAVHEIPPSGVSSLQHYEQIDEKSPFAIISKYCNVPLDSHSCEAHIFTASR